MPSSSFSAATANDAQFQQAKFFYDNGLAAFQQQDFPQAEYLLQQAVALHPTDNYCIQLGIVFGVQHKDNDAVAWFQRAIALNPKNYAPYFNIANVLQGQGQLDQALDYYQYVLALYPHSFETYLNVGKILHIQEKYDRAIAYYQQALILQPNSYETLLNLGKSCYRYGQQSQAIQYYRHAIQLQPDAAEAQFALSLSLLLLGNFEEGWQKYEYRLQFAEGGVKLPIFQKPRWDGSDLQGRRLLVLCEQGLGDTLQFSRYLSLIQGGSVIFACQAALMPLFEHFQGIHELIEYKDKAPTIPYDVYIPLMSLPALFHTTLDTVPAQTPYLHVSQIKLAQWQPRFNPQKFNIGIVWSGNPHFIDNHNRSCNLSDFLPLAQLANIQLYSLQKCAAAQQQLPELPISYLDTELHDFADTAAVLHCLDLLISVDTSVPHLAGALGRPVWLLLKYVPDCRWLLERDDSPWYSTMRLFRQTTPKNWQSVFQQIVDELPQQIDYSMRLPDNL
jgi:tetratricopeptide (TPR) repeat protein